MSQSDLITVIGPTASGKTGFAVSLAYEMNGEIISGDSRQVYRKMDIGTGKDLSDYTVNGENIPYHLIDIREPGYKYNVYEYQHDFHKVYSEIINRKKTPILCGGTGMYIEAVLKGYKLPDVPQNIILRERLEKKSLRELTEILADYKTLHNKTDVDTVKRAIRAIEIEEYSKSSLSAQNNYPPMEGVIILIDISREERRKRISERLQRRLEEGMIKEVEDILNSGVSSDDLIYYGLEYKFITLYLIGEMDYTQMVSRLEIAIHQFAKRQMTWFRGMETRGFKIHSIDGMLPMSEKIRSAKAVIEKTNMKFN